MPENPTILLISIITGRGRLCLQQVLDFFLFVLGGSISVCPMSLSLGEISMSTEILSKNR